MWIPIALSRDVPAGTTRAVIVEAREYVLWRAGSGALQLWEDRCPHRGMRLSLGFVRNDSLNCLYHGWEYASGAQCLRIPAHPDLAVPSTIRAKAFAVNEAGGMVWTSSMGDADPPKIAGAMPLCSLAIAAPPVPILAAIGAEPSETTQSCITRIAGAPVLVGWHALNGDRTMLHAVLLADGDAAGAIAALRDLRDRLEQEEAA